MASNASGSRARRFQGEMGLGNSTAPSSAQGGNQGQGVEDADTQNEQLDDFDKRRDDKQENNSTIFKKHRKRNNSLIVR